MTAPFSVRRSRMVAASAACLLALAGTLVAGSSATAAPPPKCDPRANNTVAGLLQCVTVTEVRAHQRALQRIADRNDGTRASGSPGYTASADYVAQQAAAAGLTVSRQQFDFPFYQLIGTPEFEQLAPDDATYTYGTDFQDMTYSGVGDVSGTAVPVDLLLNADGTAPGGSTSGCEDTDFPAAVAGKSR